MDEAEFQDLMDQALAALREGDYVRVVGIADQLVAAAPDRAVVRAVRAQALLGTDVPEESFCEARRAVELAPHDGYAHQLLAMAAWRTQRLGVAQESFERAVDLCGRLPSLLSEYAWFMASERGPKLAEDAAKDAVEADDQSSTAWAALGLAQYRLHRREAAQTSLCRALKLNPKDIYAQSAMLGLLRDRGQDAKADALLGLLSEYAGTEELVALARDDAKQRQLARMLVERKGDITDLVQEPRSYRWIWLVAAGGLVAAFAYLVNPWCAGLVVVATLGLLLLLRRWFD